MQKNKADHMTEVADYYTAKLNQYGETPQGVDWSNEESQTLRFEKLCGIIGTSTHFSVNDLGCGYGALYDFLTNRYDSFSYSGIDFSESMVRAAEQRNKDKFQARFVLANEPDQVADYGVASGIFNVRLARSDHEWLSYLKTTLDVLNKTSRVGFAFNCLPSYSDADKMHDYLYYANPSMLFDLCKQCYSGQVALLHDYGLYEFTILVGKI